MLLSFIEGVILGCIFFGGLYYSTKRLPEIKRPAIFMLLSITIRMGILIGGLYYIFDGEILHLFLAFAGVFASKYLIVKSVKRGVI